MAKNYQSFVSSDIYPECYCPLNFDHVVLCDPSSFAVKFLPRGLSIFLKKKNWIRVVKHNRLFLFHFFFCQLVDKMRTIHVMKIAIDD